MELMRAFNPVNIPLPNGDFSKIIARIENSSKISIEIGCGVGLHPIQFATANKDHLVIAIERTNERSRKAIKNVKDSKCDNLIFIHADAINWITHFVKPSTISQYFILYPNPYPKEKQANKRFVNMPFMAYLIETLLPSGKITIASNINTYCEEALNTMVETWHLNIIENIQIVETSVPRTHFEKKYLERGESCQNLIFSK